MTPRISGSTGRPNRRIANPSEAEHQQQGEVEGGLVDGVGAESAKNRMPAYSCGRGICSSRAHSGASGRLITSSRVLPISRLASSVHTRSAWSPINVGPGRMP